MRDNFSVRKARSLWLSGAILLWAAVMLAGFALAQQQSVAAGARGHAPLTWPAESPIQRAADSPTLLLFLHPHCPCSSASVSELERLAARTGASHIVVLFIRPSGLPDGWENTGLWRRAADIPGATCVVDADGVEARRFGAMTSGLTLVYDADAKLVFHGGVTGSRGHEGDNAGRFAAECCMRGNAAALDSTEVYGCPLAKDAR